VSHVSQLISASLAEFRQCRLLLSLVFRQSLTVWDIMWTCAWRNYTDGEDW